MNQAHLHLIVNHLPIMSTVVGIVVLIGGFVINNNIVKRTALGIFIFACLGILPAHFTGEGAEEIVEELPGISHDLIHHHEDHAAIFGWSLFVVALLALITFYMDWKNKSYVKLLYPLVFAGSIVTMVFAQQTATSGGYVRHTEIRTDNTTNPVNSPPGERNDSEENE